MSDTGKGVILDGDLVKFIDEPTGEVPPPPPPATASSTPPAPPKPTAKRATGKPPAPTADAPPPVSARAAKGAAEIEAWKNDVKTAQSRDDALQNLDLARSELNEADMAVVSAAFHERWGD